MRAKLLMYNSNNKLAHFLFILALLLNLLYHDIGNSQDEGVAEVTAEKPTYEELLAECEKVKSDRDNLLIQTQRLAQFKAEYENAVKSDEALNNKNKTLLEKNTALEAAVKTFEQRIAELEGEVAELKAKLSEVEAFADEASAQAALDELKSEKAAEISRLRIKYGSEIKELQKEIGKLDKEKAVLRDEWEKQAQNIEKESERLKKTLLEVEGEKKKNENAIAVLRMEVARLGQDNEDYAAKVKSLEAELRVVPDKFNNLAKENEVLSRRVADIHYNQGVFYSKKKEYDRAAAEFEKAIELRPYDKDSIFNLALIYAEYDIDTEKALDLFKRYLQIDNKSANADWAKRYLLRWESWREEAKHILR